MSNKAITWLIVLVVFVVLMVLASFLTDPEEGARLSGIAWIIFTLIAAVIIYAIYFATSENEAWTVGTRQVVYMAIGAALYGVITWVFNVFIPLPSISLVSLRPTVVFPIFFGYVFGPVVGFFTGAVGNILGDFLTGWGVFPVWDIGNGFMGLVPGLVMLFADRKKSLNTLVIVTAVLAVISAIIIFVSPVVPHPWTGEPTSFAGYAWVMLIACAIVIVGRYVLQAVNEDMAAVNIWGTLGIIAGMAFASIADIWISGYTFLVTMVGQFAPAASTNIVNAMILTPILLIAYQSVARQTGR